MIKKTLFYSALFAVLVGCGSSRDTAEGPANLKGSAAIAGELRVGQTLTVSVTEPNGILSGSESYQWYRSAEPLDELIAGATSSSYTLTAEDDGEEIYVVIRYTDSLGNRETNVSSPSSEVAGAFTVAVTFIHGLVDGASCNIFELDDAGVASATSAATGSTTAGVVNFDGLVPIDGNALIECTGGTYIDEATLLVLDAPDTRAIVVVDGDTSFTVSPLTEIAAQRAEAEGDFNTALTTHNDLVAAVFGLDGDITEVQPTDLSTTPVSDDAPGAYAIALALLSELDALDPGSTTAEIIEELAADLEDGFLSDEALLDVNAARAELATSPYASQIDFDVVQAVEDALNNTPEPATFEGLNGIATVGSATPATGTVTVSDVNFGEDTIVPQTDTAATYGTFSITAEGVWTYTIDNTNADVASLEPGESVNDSISIASFDGTAALMVVQVSAVTNVAVITNSINGDTGELRLNLEEHQLEGKLTFSFLKTEALGDDGNEKDAYITLYGSSGSSSESLVDLRIQGTATESDPDYPRDARFFVRNTDSDNYPDGLITAPFTPDQWYDVEMAWDMSQAKQVTITINGEVLGGGAFSTAAVVDSDFTTLDAWFDEGVERVQWRFGDNGTTIPFGSYFIDNVVIYSDFEGTTIAFEDDFEGNSVGDVLGAAPYNEETVTAAVTSYVISDSDEPTPAQIFNLTASIDSDDTEVLMEMVTVLDPDEGENLAVAQGPITTTYGTFNIMQNGAWDYTLDTADATIAALLKGEFETDIISIASVDGTTAEIVITILGVIELAPNGGLGTPGNKFANVTDVAGTTADATDGTDGKAIAVIAGSDTGELRIDLGSSNKIETGRVTFQMYKGTEFNTSIDGFFLLGGVDTGTSESILDLRFDQSGNHYDIRGGSSAVGTFNTDTIYEVEVSWDASAANAVDTAPTISITIDGVPLVTDVASGTNNFAEAVDGVRYLQFRVADGDDISRADFRIDEFVVYETVASVESEVFSDNFESYTTGHSLDSDADTKAGFELAQTPSPLIPSEYNNNSFSVTVGQEAGSLGLGNVGNKFANVTDVAGTTADATDGTDGKAIAVIAGSDTGELRIDLGSSNKIETGRVTFQMYKGTEFNTSIDGFFLLGGVDTGTSESILDLRFDQSGNHYDIRGGSSAVGTFNTDTIYEVEVSWDASAANAVDTAPTISITIDGVPLVTDVASGTNNFAEAVDGVRYLQFRVADGDDISRADFRIDEFVVYETVASVESEVFSDNFESYTTGHSLDSDADTKAGFELAQTPSPLIPSEYNNNSFSVTVGEE